MEKKIIMRNFLFPFLVNGKWYPGRITEYYDDGTESSRETKPSRYSFCKVSEA